MTCGFTSFPMTSRAALGCERALPFFQRDARSCLASVDQWNKHAAASPPPFLSDILMLPSTDAHIPPADCIRINADRHCAHIKEALNCL